MRRIGGMPNISENFCNKIYFFRFHEVLTDFLYSNSNLEIFEIADWIDELIFNDFNLILEDNSSDEISQNLVQCSKWLRANETEKIAEFLSKLPPDDRILSAAAQSSKEARGEESDSSDSESEDESMEEQVIRSLCVRI